MRLKTVINHLKHYIPTIRNGCCFLVLMTMVVWCISRTFSQVHPAESTEVSQKTAEDDRIKSMIVWETSYDEEIEDAIVCNMNMLPDSILDSWLSLESNIVVCPNVKGYLDKFHLNIEEKGSYTTGYTKISNVGETLVGVDIYILGSKANVNTSLIHEIGHYVYYVYFGANTVYVLPNFETDSVRFSETEYGSNYYSSSYKEYFAQIFTFTIQQGTTEEYPDTNVMKEIIENF